MVTTTMTLDTLSQNDLVGRWEVWPKVIGGPDDTPEAVISLGKNRKFHYNMPDDGTLLMKALTSVVNDFHGRWQLKRIKNGQPYIRFIVHRANLPVLSVLSGPFSWATSPVVYAYDRMLHPANRNVLKDLYVFDYEPGQLEVKEAWGYGPDGLSPNPTYLVKTDALYV